MKTFDYKKNPKFAEDFLKNSEPLGKALLTEATDLRSKIFVGSERTPLAVEAETKVTLASSTEQGYFLKKPRQAGVIRVRFEKNTWRKKYYQAVSDALRGGK